MLSMMSASTVDAAVERTCVGNTHGPQTPVSAIGRGRRGRWWRAAARTAAAAAALRNPGDRSVTLMYGYHLELAYKLTATHYFGHLSYIYTSGTLYGDKCDINR